VIASEKMNGTNVMLKTDNGRLVSLMNRKNPIDPLQIMKGKTFIIEGVFRAIQKGYIKEDGVQAGELIGPKVQGNPYQLDNHIWYPFEKAVKHLSYRSFLKRKEGGKVYRAKLRRDMFDWYYSKKIRILGEK